VRRFFSFLIKLFLLLLLTATAIYGGYLLYPNINEPVDPSEAQVASLEIQPRNPTITEGESIQFYAIGFDQTGKPLLTEGAQWAVSDENPGIANINERGKLTSSGYGTITVVLTLGELRAETTVGIQLDAALWRTIETDNFEIEYRQNALRHALFLEANADQHARFVLDKLQRIDQSHPVTVVIAENGTEFFERSGILPEEATASYYDNQIVLSPSAWSRQAKGSLDVEIEEATIKHILRHEYTHRIHDAIEGDLLFSNFGRFPIERDLWLVEGLAEYVSEGFSKSDAFTIRQAIRTDQVLGWAEMRGGRVYSYSAEKIQLIYLLGYTVFEHWENTYGWQSVLTLLDEVENGATYPEAMRSAFGKNPDELEAEWGEWLAIKYGD